MVATRLARAVVRAASWLVPASRREDWLREWRGELSARAGAGGPVVGAALGSFVHAWWHCRDDWMLRAGDLQRDLRYGARSLRRRPLFAVSVVATLALGLGATTAVYSLVDAVLLAPLPYPGASRFVRIEAKYDKWDVTMPGLSVEVFTEWRDRARGFDAIESYELWETFLVGAGTPAIVKEARVSPGFLPGLLAVRPRVGRLFDAEEAAGEGPRVALISEGLWRERFGGRPDAVGAVIRLNDTEAEIVGVIPAVELLPEVSVWTPARLRPDHTRTVLGSLKTIGRMGPGMTRADAVRSLESAQAEAARVHPKSMGPFAPVVEGYRSVLVGKVRTHLLLLLGAVGTLLALACVNVVSLFAARGAERRREMAVRTSLGAGRRHLISQVLAECLVLAVVAGTAGVALASLAVRGIMALLPAEMPLASAVRLDGRVLGFAAAVTLGVAALVAIASTLRAGARPAGSVDGSRHSETPGRRREGRLLLGLEVAQAAALLMAAGLMINTMVRMTSARTGFQPEGLLFLHLDLPGYSFATPDDPEGRARFMEALRQRLVAVPGVRSVGIGSATPFSGITFMTGVEPEGGIRPGSANGGIDVMDDRSDLVYFSRVYVDPGYLETLELPIVEGRGLRPADADAATPVGMINETAARAYWPDESPLGRRIREAGRGESAEWITIVGVVGDFTHPGLPTKATAEMYLPFSRDALATVSRPTALIRFDGPASDGIERIRREVWSLDPDLPIPAVSSAERALGASLAVPRFYTLLLATFAALALLLAAVGTYGVVAHSVVRRTREIGIRMALGATSRSVGTLVAREGMLVVLTGLAVGLSLGVAGSRLLRGLLYGVEPADPLTCAAVALALLAVAGLAIAVPARRAMRSDPATSVRAE